MVDVGNLETDNSAKETALLAAVRVAVGAFSADPPTDVGVTSYEI